MENYSQFCTGCGLCHSVKNVEVNIDENGFLRGKPITKDEISLCNDICPQKGNYLKKIKGGIWGEYLSVYYGYSANENIRSLASSGGVLTQICIDLVNEGLVDGIIHVESDDICPYKTRTSISMTCEDIKNHSGSRYSISSPLENIKQIVEFNKKYAFVGKPCDVSALKMYQKKYHDLDNIVFAFSFFCAGIPSNNAQKKLMSFVGVRHEQKLAELQYRGNGWPGYTILKTTDGEVYKTTYEQSWGKVLGRDVNKACRYCMDGIGLIADIVCGDAWHLNDEKKPDFSEHSGRNVILVRTSKGQEALKGSISRGSILLQEYPIDELKYIQPYQFERRSTMISKILATRLMGRRTPSYPIPYLIRCASHIKIRSQARIFKGTVERIVERRM